MKENYKKLEKWQVHAMAELIVESQRIGAYKQYVLDFYGDQAHTVCVEWGDVYNDENTTFRIIGVEVYDKEGKNIQADLSLPGWEQFKNHWWWSEEYILSKANKWGSDFAIDKVMDDYVMPWLTRPSIPLERRLRPYNGTFEMNMPSMNQVDLYVKE